MKRFLLAAAGFVAISATAAYFFSDKEEPIETYEGPVTIQEQEYDARFVRYNSEGKLCFANVKDFMRVGEKDMTILLTDNGCQDDVTYACYKPTEDYLSGAEGCKQIFPEQDPSLNIALLEVRRQIARPEFRKQ